MHTCNTYGLAVPSKSLNNKPTIKYKTEYSYILNFDIIHIYAIMQEITVNVYFNILV